jgi:sulfur-carrier protein
MFHGFMDGWMMPMRVEFFGIPRQRVGLAHIELQAASLGQLLEGLATQFATLADVINVNRLHPAFVANLNGQRFVSDPETPLAEGDCVLILSADAGG